MAVVDIGNEVDFHSPIHPDGKPWDKCCGNKKDCQCAFRRYPRSEGKGKSRYQTSNHIFPSKKTDRPFVCRHRRDDGSLRVCAGWHAVYGKRDQTYKPFDVKEYD